MSQSRVQSPEKSEHSSIDSVKEYLSEIGKFPLLTHQDEIELSQRVQRGLWAEEQIEQFEQVDEQSRSQLVFTELRDLEYDGLQARKDFVNANLRLVVMVAKRYQHSGLPLLDLIQEGNLGLMHAVKKFDGQKGFRFSTYGVWWIRQYVARGIAEKGGVVSWPVKAADQMHAIRDFRESFRSEHGYDTSAEEIATGINLSTPRVRELLHLVDDVASLDSPVHQEGASETLGDFLEDKSQTTIESQVLNAIAAERVAAALQCLNERELTIITMKYGIGDGVRWSNKEIASTMNLSRERIRQLEAGAMARLRHPSMRALIADLL